MRSSAERLIELCRGPGRLWSKNGVSRLQKFIRCVVIVGDHSRPYLSSIAIFREGHMKTTLFALTLLLVAITAAVVYAKAAVCDVETGENCQPPRR
jgi:hypothetical protein